MVALAPRATDVRVIPVRTGHSRERVPLLLLFGFLIAVYAATSGGYPSSVDDDSMFYAAQGIVARGDPALPAADNSGMGAVAGPGGKLYSAPSHGILTPLLAIPLYVAGDQAARLFPPQYHGYLTRLAATGLSVLLTAGAAVVLTRIALELGASGAGSIIIGLLYGLGTIAWPYAKYLWSEPSATLMLLLAVYFSIRAARTAAPRQWMAAGAFLILMTAARPSAAIVIPVFVAYLLVGARRRAVRRQLWALGLPFVAIGGCLLLAAGVLFSLHGSLLTAVGSQVVAAMWALQASLHPELLGTGLKGLLVSPGKSVFLYSPPLFAALAALPAFCRRWPREALLAGGVALVSVLFTGMLALWTGDPSWGPRYLVPFSPCLLLALTAWFDPARKPPRFARALLIATAALGVVVQVFAVTTNYHTFETVSSIAAEAQLKAANFPMQHELDAANQAQQGISQRAVLLRAFDPAWSPLAGAPVQLAQNIAEHFSPLPAGHYRLRVDPRDYRVRDGELYPWEIAASSPTLWSNGHARVDFVPNDGQPLTARLRIFQPDTGARRPVPALSVYVDADPKPLAMTGVAEPSEGVYELTLALPALSPDQHSLEIISPAFVPADVQHSSDSRALGVGIQELRLTSATGGELQPVEQTVVPALPVSTGQPWGGRARGWFYDPSIPQLVDLWPWYVVKSGLPPVLALLAVIPLAGAVWFGRQLLRFLRGKPAATAPWGDLRLWRLPALPLSFGTFGVVTLVLAAGCSHAAQGAPTAGIAPSSVAAIDAPAGLAAPASSVVLSGHAFDPRGINAVEVYFDRRLMGQAALGGTAPGTWQYRLDLSGATSGEHSVTALAHPAGQRAPLESTASLALLQPGQYGLNAGFYGSESNLRAALPRWTNGQAVLDLLPRRPGRIELDADFEQRAASMRPGHTVPDVSLVWDGKPGIPGGWSAQPIAPGLYALHVSIDPGPGPARPHRLELATPPFVPKDAEPGSQDTRSLGIYIRTLSISGGGDPLRDVSQIAAPGSLLVPDGGQVAAPGALLG